MSTDEESVDVIFKTLKVPGARGGSYGLSFRGSYPVMLGDIEPGSPADEAGLKKGDFLVLLNGNDIQRSSEEAVKTIIKYSHGSQLTVRIARPHPFPSTDYLRRRAIITLQTKLAAGVADTSEEAATYKKTVESAFLEVQDILGTLGLGGDDDFLPSARGKGHEAQEVKVQYPGNKSSLQSPPDTDRDPFDVLDPLLNFGLDDDFSLGKGTGGGASSGADLMKSTFEIQRALKGMKQLTEDINATKEKKRLSKQTAPQERVTTEATFTPSYERTHQPPPSHTDPPPVPSSPRPTQKFDVPPAESSLYATVSDPDPPVNGVRERVTVQEQSSLHAERDVFASDGFQQESYNWQQAPWLREREDVPSNSRRGGPPREAPPTYGRGQSKATRNNIEESAPPPTVPLYRPREESKPPFVLASSSSPPPSTRPAADLEDPYAPPPIPNYNPAGPENFLLSNKPEYRQELKRMTNTYESVGDRDSSPSPPSTYEVVRETGPRSQSPQPYEIFGADRSSNPEPFTSQGRESNGERERSSGNLSVPGPTYESVRGEGYSNGQPANILLRPFADGGEGRELERSTSPPPPVPVRQHHSLAKTYSAPPPKSPSKDRYNSSLANVPLRSKNRRGGNQSGNGATGTGQESMPAGGVDQGGKMKYDINSSVSSRAAPVTDVADILTACAGLPSNVHQWKKEDVGVWLRQMSSTLYDRYSSLFSKHDVTGRTLLRLNATKLQSLGVTTPAHCRILATEIMRVRIHQEANELRSFKR